MALTGAHAPGATPLTEEDIRGLKLASIAITDLCEVIFESLNVSHPTRQMPATLHLATRRHTTF
jgi:hypothetical protein